MSLNHDKLQAAPVLTPRVEQPADRVPSLVALTAAKNVARRNHNRSLPLRRLFAERLDMETEITPLAQMLRGGRGGSVRLRLYLAMVWLGAASPHEVSYPYRAWAELLDLPDPGGAGSRRIADAIRWLEKHEYVEVENRSGAPNGVWLLSDAGTGAAYELPGAAWNRYRGDFGAQSQHRYIQLPPELWTSGWMAVLNQASIAMLIVLFVQLGASDADDSELWIAPDYAAQTFMLSEETRTRGLRELANTGLITTRRRALVASDSFDIRRFRNVHRINLEAIKNDARIRLGKPAKDAAEEDVF
jgi:hypothetical protein